MQDKLKCKYIQLYSTLADYGILHKYINLLLTALKFYNALCRMRRILILLLYLISPACEECSYHEF